MAISMTGYGAAEAQWESWICLVEIRSVNQRFLDTRIRLPQGFQTLEQDFKKEIKQVCSRGKIECTIKLEQNSQQENLQLDEERANAFHQHMTQFEQMTGRTVSVTARDLVASSIIIESTNINPPEECADLLRGCLKEALQSMDQMKRLEGQAMSEDIQSRLTQCETIVNRIEDDSKEEPQKHKEKLRERLEQLTSSAEFNEERLEQEIAILADRQDISEEIVRFRTHLTHMQEILSKREAGKKAEFLMQEFNREVNTMASKSNHAGISQSTVEIKSELEKIREQLANIE